MSVCWYSIDLWTENDTYTYVVLYQYKSSTILKVFCSKLLSAKISRRVILFTRQIKNRYIDNNYCQLDFQINWINVYCFIASPNPYTNRKIHDSQTSAWAIQHQSSRRRIQPEMRGSRRTATQTLTEMLTYIGEPIGPLEIRGARFRVYLILSCACSARGLVHD